MIPQGCFAYFAPEPDGPSSQSSISRSRGFTVPTSPVSSKLNPFKSHRHGSGSRLSNKDNSPALTLDSNRSSTLYSECDPILPSRPATGLGISTEADRTDSDSHSPQSIHRFFQLRPRKRNNSPDADFQTSPSSNRLRQLLRHPSVTEIIHWTPPKDVAPSLEIPQGLGISFADSTYLSSPESTIFSSPGCPTFSSAESSPDLSRTSMDSSTVGRSPALPQINGTAGNSEPHDDDGTQTTPQPTPLPSETPQQMHTRVASPTTTRPPTSGSSSGSSHLSGLVCNVHRTTGKEPHPLVGATTTIIDDILYVFGGRRLSRARSGPTSDLYQLDLLRRHWSKVETRGDIPPARYFHSMCALGSTKMVCYGGMSPEAVPPQAAATSASTAEPAEAQVTVMSDVHIYDIATKTWTRIETQDPPQGRYAHCAAILPSAAVLASYGPSSGSGPRSQLTARDGRGGAEMLIVGGQDSSNRYIEQISIFNLRSLTWTSTRPMPGRSCGAYRSVVIPLTTMSAAQVGDPAAAGQDRPMPDGEAIGSGSPMLMYTNYNFLDVKLELQIRNTDGSLSDKAMQGSVSPPGLRFPSGGILNNHFVVSGTFLTSSKQEFALWALDLKNLTWSKIDTANSVFSQGSWNRGVLWPRRNAFVCLGHRKRNLVEDYNNRRLNFTNLCLVQLETFGLYDNPRKLFPTSDYASVSSHVAHNLVGADRAAGGRWLGSTAVGLGKQSQAMRELSDMDFVAVDGTRLAVNSRMVALRWGPYFAILMHEAIAGNDDAATLRGGGSAFGDMSRNSSVTITPSVNTAYSIATTVTANNSSDDKAAAASNRPRALYLPHTAPTLKTLIYYLYTSSLPPIASPMTTPQILCSLLQLARPYKVDGLLEAVIERLHESLDGRNAAAIFNAAAMGAGGGENESQAVAASATLSHPPRGASLAGINVEGLDLNGANSTSNTTGTAGPGAVNGLRIISDLSNGIANEDDRPPNSAASTLSMRSQASQLSQGGSLLEEAEIWDGGWSAVIGLQKRGLRGLMEGRRMRERGKGPEMSASASASSEHQGHSIGPGVGSAGGMQQGTESGRVGLGIA